METVLISFSICVLGVIGAVTLFSVAMRTRNEEAEPGNRNGIANSAPGFFLDAIGVQQARSHLSSETLLLELERHFRLEERAASSFLEGPTIDSLHTPSNSPLWD